MKSPLSPSLRVSASISLAAAMSLAARAAGPTIHYIDLHPPGAVESSANAISGNEQVGTVYINYTSNYYRAARWTGTPESIIYLTQETTPNVTRSSAMATDHGVHGGYIKRTDPNGNDPILWNPQTGTEINLLPPNWRHAFVRGMGGGRQVGYAEYPDGANGYVCHAMLWSGTAESFIDLHPAGWLNSRAYATNGPQKVGIVSNYTTGLDRPNGHAALWQEDAASFIDLQPAGFNYSIARCTTGEIQGGSVTAGGTYRAGIWRGTTESFVSLHPDGAIGSVIYGGDETWQVGLASFDGNSHACAWQGSTDSFLDLHSVLENDGYTESAAGGVEVNGLTVKVCGYARYGGITNHAVLWTIDLPDTEPPVIESATVTPDSLWPPNGKLTRVSVDAQVTDEYGETAWYINDVTCNERFKYGDIGILDDHTVQLRATRSGSNHDGRIYSIILIAEDSAGNLSNPFEVEVIVPHDSKARQHGRPQCHGKGSIQR